MNELKRKSTKLQWGDSQQKSFDEAKKLLTTAPILQMPDFSKEFVLSCVASQTGIGAFLGQYQDNILLSIAYYSRKL